MIGSLNAGIVTKMPRMVADWLGQKLYITITGLNLGKTTTDISLYVFERGEFQPPESLASFVPATFLLGSSENSIVPMIDSYNHLVYIFAKSTATGLGITSLTRVGASDFKAANFAMNTATVFGGLI